MLFRGAAGRLYSVGSDAALPILEVTRHVAAACDPVPAVEVHGAPTPGAAPDRYVPLVARARAELGLAPRIELADAISRTLRWYAARAGATP